MSAPSITLQPASQTVVRTNAITATFTVTAVGTSPLSYQWQVDSGGGFSPIINATAPTLTLNNINKTLDQYKYRCVVTNSEGTATSNAAVLAVFDGPQITAFSPTNASGVTTATLTSDYPTGQGEAVEVAAILPNGRLAISFPTTPASETTTTSTTTVGGSTTTTSTTTVAPSGQFPVPAVNQFYNSTEFEMSAGVPTDSNILLMDDFARGWYYKANGDGFLLGSSGTRIFTGSPRDSGNLQYTAGWAGTIFSQTPIPNPDGIPGIGNDASPDIWLRTQSGRGGAQYAASKGNGNNDWFASHNFAEATDHFFMRFDVFFYSGYLFGAEKIATINPLNQDGGIIWGNIQINRGAGSAQSFGVIDWQGVSETSPSWSTGYSMASGKWYSIQLELDKRGSPGTHKLRIYVDDLGADGNTIPPDRMPTLRLERTDYTFAPSVGSHTLFGNIWWEAWANPLSVGSQKRTNLVVRKGAGGVIPIRVPIITTTTTSTTTVGGSTTTTSTTTVGGSPGDPFTGTVDVNIYRLDDGSGTTLVSSGMPLQPGMVYANTLGQFKLMMNNTEVPLFVQPLFGKHADGSYRSVLIQFEMALSANQVLPGQLIFGVPGARQGTRTAIAGDLESAVILPMSPQYIISTGVIPLTRSSSQVSATTLATLGQNFDTQYLSAANLHPITPERSGTLLTLELNFYDRVLSSYAQWARTGEVRYWKDASLLLRQYVTVGWQIEATGRIPPKDFHPDGLFVGYLLTGHELARTLFPEFALFPGTSSFWTPAFIDPGLTNYREGRDQSRIMLACLYSALLEDTTRNWFAVTDTFLNMWLDTQEPYFRAPQTGYDGAWLYSLSAEGDQSNFMEGLRVTSLITYLELRNPSSTLRTRIEDAIKKQVDFLWNTQWQPQFKSFKYWSSEATGARGLADLNNLMVLGFAYVYHITGNIEYYNRTIEIISQAFFPQPDWSGVFWVGGNGKFFNQNYYSSFRVFYYLNSVRS